MSALDPGRRVVVGKVVGIWGVQGWVKIHSYTQSRDDIFGYNPWWIGTGKDARECRLAAGREQGAGLVAKLDDIDDPDAARKLIDQDIAITGSQLPTLEEGEFFWHQLEDLAVVNTDGMRLGQVAYLIETGANDVMVVRGERERLIPYVDHVVKVVDLHLGTIEVDWDAEF